MKKDTGKMRISACMMVKNEEEMLPRCLNSIKHLIDELIIVDTGSTDKTIEIAESFGAKIYHHPWENNFSKHRNQSLGYATGDWLIQIDADEELNGYHLKKNDLKKMFGNAPKEQHCFLIKMLDKNKKGETVTETEMARIFRNHVGVHFTGIVHNQPQYSGKVGHSNIQFFHYGYALSDDQMQAKYRRTSGLLFKRIEMDPQDYDAYFYLYQVHSEMNEKQKAIEYAEKCLEIVKEKKLDSVQASFYFSLYHGLANTYIKSGQYDSAQHFIRKGLEMLPDEPDLYYDLAAVGYLSNSPELSVEGGKNYLRAVEEFRRNPLKAGTRFIFTTTKKAEVSVCLWLMLGLIALNRLNEFLQLWEQYKADMVDKSSFQRILFESIEKKEQFEYLEPVAAFLFNEQEKVPVENHKMIFSFLLFYLSEKAHQVEDSSELKAVFESVTAQYLDKIDSYRDLPTGDTVILADYFLNKNMGKFFLDLTVTVFERELGGEIKVIDSNDTMAYGYKSIAKKQPKTRKGKYLAVLCLNICARLSQNTRDKNNEADVKNHDDITPSIDNQKAAKKLLITGTGQLETAGLKKNKYPLVSVGLNVFNGGHDLAESIRSILDQDYENFELIILDNCSTDHTEDICRNYAAQDKRIFYLRFDQNHGLSVNRRTVFGLTRGEYFVFARHDNTFSPKFLSACLDEFIKDEDQSVEIVFPQVNISEGENRYRPYSDPLNAIQDDPVERYLHVLQVTDLANAILGMARSRSLRNNRILFGVLSTKMLFTDNAYLSAIALNGKIKQIGQRLLNRKISDYSVENGLQQVITGIKAEGSYLLNDGISLPSVGMIRLQMDIIKYAPLSFTQKNILIEETIKCLKLRFHEPMLYEINRAVSLVKNHSFFTTWEDERLPTGVLNELKFFKREYLFNLHRELEYALFIFPEVEQLKQAVEICDKYAKENA